MAGVGKVVFGYEDEAIEIIVGPGVSSANHCYAATLQLALIPSGFDNTVIAINVPAR